MYHDVHYSITYTKDLVEENKMADDTMKELWESLSNFVNDSLFSFFWLYAKRYNATVVTNKFRISFLF